MLEIKNKNMRMVLEFVRNNLVAENSMENIHRMRVVKNLEAHAKSLEEERQEIIKEHAEKDEDGEVIQDEKGNVNVYDAAALDKQMVAFYNESYTLADPNLKSAVDTIAKLVKEFKGNLSGDAAEAHYILIETLNLENELEV